MRGDDLHYGDGGTLCNFPIHVFDGWWLSMAPDDSFIQRVGHAVTAGDTVNELYVSTSTRRSPHHILISGEVMITDSLRFQAKSNRFGEKDWETVGLCLTAEADVSDMNR